MIDLAVPEHVGAGGELDADRVAAGKGRAMRDAAAEKWYMERLLPAPAEAAGKKENQRD